MNVMRELLQQKLAETEEKSKEVQQKDAWRLGYHIMPPAGWLNDPNGLCQYGDQYYVFFQYAPFDAEGGLKMWGQYSSRDLVHWKYEGAPILPDSPFDCHGVYSGCAFTEDGILEIFYTGNVKYEGAYDYIHNGREANIVYTASRDGKQFLEKECLLTNKDYPDGYTNHIRDPKVWRQGKKYYMVLGGRKSSDTGAVLLYTSSDKKKWTLAGEITTKAPFGYMWECPDLFEMDSQWILSVSPQGLEKEAYCYQNVYQSGWFLLDGEPEGEYRLSDFQEWDMGFDFYAPQTFQDKNGRRLLIGWAGMPDAADQYQNPTVERGWQHALTVPRELTLQNKRVYQYPAEEINCLRGKEQEIFTGQEIQLENPWFDWEITEISSEKCVITIEQECRFTYEDGICCLEFTGSLGAGRKERRALLSNLNKIRILGDASMLEIYLNDGECVFTTRFYPKGTSRHLAYECNAAKSRLWQMEPSK